MKETVFEMHLKEEGKAAALAASSHGLAAVKAATPEHWHPSGEQEECENKSKFRQRNRQIIKCFALI